MGYIGQRKSCITRYGSTSLTMEEMFGLKFLKKWNKNKKKCLHKATKYVEKFQQQWYVNNVMAMWKVDKPLWKLIGPRSSSVDST